MSRGRSHHLYPRAGEPVVLTSYASCRLSAYTTTGVTGEVPGKYATCRLHMSRPSFACLISIFSTRADVEHFIAKWRTVLFSNYVGLILFSYLTAFNNNGHWTASLHVIR